MKIIDAHHHFWNVEDNYLPWLADKPVSFRYGDYSAIRRNYLPDEYVEDAGNFQIAGSVFIETEWDPTDPIGEVDWVRSIRNQSKLPSVMVAQAWLDRDDVDAVLESHGRAGFVRAIRHKPTAATSPSKAVAGARGAMADPNWRRGYALLGQNGLSFDLQTPWWHLGEALDLARAYPEVLISLNHTGLPSDRSNEGLTGWAAALRDFATAPNTVLKISGIGLPGKTWSVADNKAVVLKAIDVFGPERCMFASNFPVDSLVGSFETIFGGFSEITAGFSEDERAGMFYSNAKKFYRINETDLIVGTA